MKTKEEIKAFFDKELLADLVNFDKRRKRAFNKALIYRIISNLGLLSLVFCYYYPMLLVLNLIVSLGIYIKFHLTAKTIVSVENFNIYNEYKGNIITSVLNELFENVNYVPYQFISIKAIKESNIFGEFFNLDAGEDYFKCEIKDVVFQFSEISLSGDIAILLPDNYNGIFAVSEFNKNFVTKTLIIPRSKIPFYRNKYQRIAGKKGFKRVFLEDPIFSEEYVVYGQDQVESRYLLTPSFISHILNFQKKLHSRVVFSFAENSLNLFIINSKNLFEPPKRKSFTDFEYFYQNINYFILFSSIVDELKLNVKIWGRS